MITEKDIVEEFTTNLLNNYYLMEESFYHKGKLLNKEEEKFYVSKIANYNKKIFKNKKIQPYLKILVNFFNELENNGKILAIIAHKQDSNLLNFNRYEYMEHINSIYVYDDGEPIQRRYIHTGSAGDQLECVKAIDMLQGFACNNLMFEKIVIDNSALYTSKEVNELFLKIKELRENDSSKLFNCDLEDINILNFDKSKNTLIDNYKELSNQASMPVEIKTSEKPLISDYLLNNIFVHYKDCKDPVVLYDLAIELFYYGGMHIYFANKIYQKLNLEQRDLILNKVSKIKSESVNILFISLIKDKIERDGSEFLQLDIHENSDYLYLNSPYINQLVYMEFALDWNAVGIRASEQEGRIPYRLSWEPSDESKIGYGFYDGKKCFKVDKNIYPQINKDNFMPLLLKSLQFSFDKVVLGDKRDTGDIVDEEFYKIYREEILNAKLEVINKENMNGKIKRNKI